MNLLRNFELETGWCFIKHQKKKALFKKPDGNFATLPSAMFHDSPEKKPTELYYGFDADEEFTEYKTSTYKNPERHKLDRTSFKAGFFQACLKMHGACPECSLEDVRNDKELENATNT